MDEVVAESAHLSPGCLEVIQTATREIDHIIESGTPEEIQAMYKALGNHIPNIEYGDFMYYVADIFTGGVQGGRRTSMCDRITSDAFKSDIINQTGLLAKDYGMNADDYAASSIANTTVDMYKNMRQWAYQYCHEFGWF